MLVASRLHDHSRSYAFPLSTSFKWTLLDLRQFAYKGLLALSYDRYVWDKTRKCGVSFIF